MIVLRNTNKKINSIIHIADIHIRLTKRHDEYESVFNGFYKKLNKASKDSILVISGDLFHSKTDLSPECVDLGSKFLNKCANILPTILIAGNHDATLANKSRLDSITPIVESLNNENLHYLKKSQLYRYENLLLNNYSVFDSVEDYILFDKIDDKNLIDIDHTIVLFHGAVNGAITDIGYQINNRIISKKLFEGHDFVLLGDIHKFQKMNNDGETPIMVYPSSMIQQNHGETLNGHGYVVWDLNNGDFKHHELKNDYGYFTANVLHGNLETDISAIPKNTRLRVFHKNTSPSDLKKVIESIESKTNIVESAYIRQENEFEDELFDTDLFKTNDFSDVSYQNKIIEEHLLKNDFDKDHIDKIKEINVDVNSKLSSNVQTIDKNVIWKPKKFEFSNMFSYGEKNVVDFSNLNGIIGLFAKNAEGKCVDKDTEIEIKYDKENIISNIGHIPQELVGNTVTIETIYNIFKKYGDLNLNVNTPYGYKHIEACDITAKNSQVLLVTTTYGLSLKCSPNHLIKLKNGCFRKAIELLPHNIIQTINGYEKIVSIETLPYTDDLYDIQVADVKQYYSNKIVSHNSSIFDSLCFCLFDKFSRGYRAIHVLNIYKKKFECKFNFEINGVDYFIEKKGVSDKKGNVKVSIDFWKEEDGKVVNLNGEARKNTNDIIRDYIGTYEDFVITVLSLQNNKFGSFIELPQSERKDLICQFIGLNIYDSLHKISNDKYKELFSNLKFYNLDKLNEKNKQLSEEIVEYNSSVIEYDKKINEKSNIKKSLSEEIISLSGGLVKTSNDNFDISKAESTIEDIKQKLKTQDLKENVENDSLKKLNIKLSSIGIDNSSIDELKSDNLNYNKYNELIVKKDFEINNLKSIVKQKLNILENLKNHKYDPNCKYCIDNVFVKDAIKTKGELETDKQVAAKLLKEKKDLEKTFNKYKDGKEKYLEYVEKQETIKQIENQISTVKNYILNIKNNKLELENTKTNLELKIKDYYENIESIKSNDTIYLKIKEKKEDLEKIEDELDILNKLVYNIKNNINRNKTDIENIKSEIDKVLKLQNECDLYKQYVTLVNRDGLPLQIVNNILPSIEKEINVILHTIVDFNINMESDGKNISAFIEYNDTKKWPLEIGSGMEKFISGLAIRIALIHISNIPRPNMICIDEGWGSLDSNNLSAVASLFDILRTKFDFSWIISHLENMKDIVDSHIEISKINGFSKVVNV